MFFEKHIRPALIEHCYECHSEKGKVKGGLLLDRKAGWVTGGDSGTAIVPGNPGGSLIMEALHYGNPDIEMPPKGKLPDDVIAKFETWIASGAVDPRDEPASSEKQPEIDIEVGRKYWSFQPIQREHPSPAGSEANIDHLLQAKLSSEGLKPAGPASAEMRLRRAKTDLTGLLPTIEELDEFLARPTDAKFAEMIDRWLASPAFGERWGRHWLDLARYADTSGGGRAMTLPDAWRFRDFVIEAFAEDLPLDQLIRMHIAGDLISEGMSLKQRRQALTATGFLVLGPHNYENQNKKLLELEIADEQVDTIGRAFMGMTIGCARCHDHKFDPIPTADYYSMAGIFLSTQSVNHANVSKWQTAPLPEPPAVEKAQQQFKAQQQKLNGKIANLEKQLKGKLSKSVSVAGLAGIVLDTDDAEIVGQWQESTSNGRFVGDHYLHDESAKRGEKSVVYRHTFEKAGRYELRVSYSPGSNRTSRAEIRVGLSPRNERIHRINQRSKPGINGLFHKVGLFEIEAGQEVRVTIANNETTDGVLIADAVQWLPYRGPEEPALTEQRRNEQKLAAELDRLKAELRELEKSAPEIARVMSVADAEQSKIGDTSIRIRGVENNHGEIAPRGFLQVASWAPVEIPETTSGRLELANWIAHAENPLTARVLANRIWYHLMGKGIVSSLDNFGTTGTLPSHPVLLDYLASRLIESGWSTKQLIREIMLSRAYSRTSSHDDPAALVKDPDNRWYWKGNVRFLDAEVMRDGVLTLSGSLDRNSGGPSLPKGFRSEFGYQFTTRKRSVYVPVFRNQGHEMLKLFDFANPNFIVGERSTSSIPTQALFMTNGKFIFRESQQLADRLLQESSASDREKVRQVYRQILGRFPDPEEERLALNFLSELSGQSNNNRARAWSRLVHSLFACVDYRILR